MSNRSTKQIIFGTFYLLILVVLGGVLYFLFFRQLPSCFDNRKNQDEVGIDCGGPCISCDIKMAKSLEIVWVKAFQVTNKKISVAAKIRNPNLNVGAKNFDYKFDIYGPFGVKLQTISDSSFIYPGEVKYIVGAGIDLPSAEEISGAEFGDSNWQWVDKDKFIKPELIVRDLTATFLKSKEKFLEIAGIVRNDSSYNLDKVGVNVIIYEKKSGIPLAASKTEVKNLLSLQEAPFKFIFPESFAASSSLDLDKIEITFEAKI